jgi:hypothetical protein
MPKIFMPGKKRNRIGKVEAVEAVEAKSGKF